jgi:hypothetical protein
MDGRTMSQRNVERIVGRLVTDEKFRRRFWEDSPRALQELVAEGCELNACEYRALRSMTRESVERFAESIDPRIQKSDLMGEER